MGVSLVSSLKSYVTRLENKYFDPALSRQNVLHRLDTIISNVLDKARDQSLDTYIVEETVSIQLDRFWAWAKRRIIDVTEACKVFNRSRSTIYRWIKQGKLAHAIKENGRWRIAL